MVNRDLFVQRIRTLTDPLQPIDSGHKARLKQIPGIRCVAFDFYGTLFISAVGEIGIDEEQQQKSVYWFAEALKDTGFEIIRNGVGKKGITIFNQTVESYVRAARDEGIDYPEPNIISVWSDVLGSLVESGDIRGMAGYEEAVRFGIEFEFRINNTWPAPKLSHILNKLKSRNLELGIISNSQFYTPIAFEALLNAPPSKFGFNKKLLIWSYQAKLKKPSTDLYRLFVEAAKKEKLEPREILYVGNDIRKDIQPAKELGLRTALFVGDQRSIRHRPEDLRKPGYRPDLVIDDLAQIDDCLTN